MMIKKMEKLKIVRIATEDYPNGRIDSFTVPLLDKSNQGISVNYIIPLLKDFGFTDDSVEELDIDFENMSAGDHYFIYGNDNIKAILIIEDKAISINFDNNLDKKKINEIVERYFQFPE